METKSHSFAKSPCLTAEAAAGMAYMAELPRWDSSRSAPRNHLNYKDIDN